MLLIWIAIFIVSLIVLVKGADWLLSSSEKIGLALGLSPFVVGVVIVGFGTSFPELVSSLFATFQGATEIVAANAIGSNIANILLIIGLSAVIGGKIVVKKNLIDLDLPLLAIGTVLLLGVVADRQITLIESLIFLLSYVIYLVYTIIHKEEEEENIETLPSRVTRRGSVKKKISKKKESRPKLLPMDFVVLVGGIIGLILGAKYLIDSVVAISEIMGIATGVIAITAVAFGTSLPELLVSLKAVARKKSDVALGNIFGSNIFNMFVVIGLPGLFGTLAIDQPTFTIGVPMVALATLIFVISGISRRIHVWEGAFYLILYAFFLIKLFG